MSRILVWDLPTRVFHWILTALVLGAFAIALGAESGTSVFALHKLLGLVAAVAVLLRLVWGLVGSKYARFSALVFSPADLVGYLRGVLSRTAPRYVGHNPGSSYAIWAMLVLGLVVPVTGLGLASGNEVFDEMHEPLAFTLLAVVAAHLAGVAVHTIRHKEPITLSMISGKKEGEPEQAIPSAHALVGVVFLVLGGAWAAALYGGYDAGSGQLTLPLLGKMVPLRSGAEPGEESDDKEDSARPGDSTGEYGGGDRKHEGEH